MDLVLEMRGVSSHEGPSGANAAQTLEGVYINSKWMVPKISNND